jgi:hypothetical protein
MPRYSSFRPRSCWRKLTPKCYLVMVVSTLMLCNFLVSLNYDCFVNFLLIIFFYFAEVNVLPICKTPSCSSSSSKTPSIIQSSWRNKKMLKVHRIEATNLLRQNRCVLFIISHFIVI